MKRITITILMSSGEDIEESAVAWERVLRNTHTIAPDDTVESITIKEA